MDRRSRKPRKASVEDDLAVVKAAAWAWYERGSGSETRAMPEFDLSMRARRREPKPSRYKLEAEAMKLESREMHPFSPLSSSASNSEVHSLLDDYEIERISRQLDRYVESSRADYFKGVFGIGGDRRAHNKMASPGSDEKRKSKSLSLISRGFWFKYGSTCSSRIDDVVQGRSIKVMYVRSGGGSGRKRV